MKMIALLTLALSMTFVGCKNRGGSSDDYNTDRGSTWESSTNRTGTFTNGTNNLPGNRGRTNGTNAATPSDTYPSQPQR